MIDDWKPERQERPRRSSIRGLNTARTKCYSLWLVWLVYPQKDAPCTLAWYGFVYGKHCAAVNAAVLLGYFKEVEEQNQING